jgi:excisionase family DNA binding protein
MTPDTLMRVSPIPRMALNLEEAGQATDLCSKTVGKLISDGRLRCVMVGTRRLIPIVEIQRWLDREAAQSSEQVAAMRAGRDAETGSRHREPQSSEQGADA